MSNENPAVNPLVEAPADTWSVALARKAANDFIQAHGEPWVSSDLAYLAEAGNPSWEPHAWVVNAIREAHDIGILQGRANGNAVAEAQHEQHLMELTGIVRATIAAALEAQRPILEATGMELPYVQFDPAKLATVFDRVDLDFTVGADGKFTYTLYPSARQGAANDAEEVVIKSLKAPAARKTPARKQKATKVVKPKSSKPNGAA